MSKYIGSGEDDSQRQKLNKLGGTEWAKQKSKAKKAVKDLAREAGARPNAVTKRLLRLRESLRRTLEKEGVAL